MSKPNKFLDSYFSIGFLWSFIADLYLVNLQEPQFSTTATFLLSECRFPWRALSLIMIRSSSRAIDYVLNLSTLFYADCSNMPEPVQELLCVSLTQGRQDSAILRMLRVYW